MIENYLRLSNGVIKQIEINKPKVYDIEYINERYNSYGVKGPQMAGLRLGHLVANLKNTPNSILDVGYGNGDFLKLCSQAIDKCFGNDISGYPVPDGAEFVQNIFDNHYDVICFFDVLEHFEDIEFIEKLKCNFIYISVPWCHYFSDEWFLSWKHRRENEHLWHFNDESITNFFGELGYELIVKSNIEDLIRKSSDANQNILTCIFKKQTNYII